MKTHGDYQGSGGLKGTQEDTVELMRTQGNLGALMGAQEDSG